MLDLKKFNEGDIVDIKNVKSRYSYIVDGVDRVNGIAFLVSEFYDFIDLSQDDLAEITICVPFDNLYHYKE